MSFSGKLLVVLVAWTLCVSSAGADDHTRSSLAVQEAGLDNPEALVALAVKYEHAEGVKQDFAKAADLYCRAARLGFAGAQFALGWMYANGRGVSRDDGVAAHLFAMAAEQGHEHAQEMVRYTRSSAATSLPRCLLPEESAPETGNGPEPVDAKVYPKGPIFTLVQQLSPRYSVDPKLVLAIISVESGFNVRAVSPKNAQGLMQLIPETAHRFRVKNAFDPAQNIQGGLAYLQWLLAFFKGNVPLVAAAYNAGERAVERHRGIPPYPETRDYVRKITALYGKSTHPFLINLAETSSFVALPVNYPQ
ncbi:lytic transglycosylase, catalytic [Sulfuricella denitrificans skB26]|uniref:Lytic transglycosylase, catalytic n=1 Tax=Sulfuricella denitrificans (strain DSM 22764 / NBRC 105220 / skB26) TaxID=1163617 RepID=S6B8Z4_SULDS|nr:transglycosylase SLT domain-containing protein [Sulfuricella denitrificans]BAN36792.1 lytic transglycosylase, catalytic [Sulfuricella denitrificans skB26]